MSERTLGRAAQRTLAALGAAALVLLGSFAASNAAVAADGDPSPSNIVGTKGSLTIHKFGGDPVDLPNNGKPIADTSGLGTPLSGVEFSIQRVSYMGNPINLGTMEGWDQAQAATPANVGTAPYSLGAVSTVTTVGGAVTIPNLDFGLYLVKETSPGPNPIVSPVADFLVSVPYPDSTNSTWIYDVHVYPKNKLNTTTPEKTVSDPGTPVLGSSVDWTIKAPVPALAAGDTYSKFIVTDDLDERLSLTAVSVSLNATPLVLGTDYTLSPSPLPVAGGPLVTVTLTGALDDLEADDNVFITLTTTVDSLGADGKILNKGLVNVNDSVRETNQPQTNWGPLKVVKKAAIAPKNTLAGAEFEVWTAKEGDAGAAKVLGPVATNAAGEIEVAGLWVGNGAVLSKTYWLKETKAPAGYILPTGDAAWTSVVVNAAGAASPVVITIENTQQRGPNLPLTGSTGTTMFLLGGIALLLTAGGAALVGARRKHHAAE